ncbi:MAG: CNNM domain-containing protein [Candidatus Omnitrophica bacterium]|nr:CNNM domain-containing protein [Candidatus Omnitrophota bacterium]MDD5352978.1 CNNM domain-containing protein [Candidatus Omnitrophota bacterium]MDD5550577.1 CNNM domain-containing protein [Candidatus Omnitrophota bacterium]
MIAAYILYIILSVVLVAFFAGGETAFTSVKFMKLMHLIEKKDKSALLVHNILKRPDKLLTTTLVGTNIAVVVASALATNLFFQFSPQYASTIATFFMVPFILIFGEIVPKTICQNKSNQISLKIAPLIMFSQKIFSPLNAIISVITTSLLNVIGPRTIKKNPFLTKDEIKLIIRDVTKEGIIEDYEREVIDRIFDFTLTKAADIMVPIKNVACIDCKQPKEEILEKSKSFGFTRLPVFEGKNIKGVVNIFDIFYNEKDKDWHGFIRPLRSVAFDERLDYVFSVMQPNKEAMVVVLKDNSPIGILTMEDLIEEIVYSTKLVLKE